MLTVSGEEGIERTWVGGDAKSWEEDAEGTPMDDIEEYKYEHEEEDRVPEESECSDVELGGLAGGKAGEDELFIVSLSASACGGREVALTADEWAASLTILEGALELPWLTMPMKGGGGGGTAREARRARVGILKAAKSAGDDV